MVTNGDIQFSSITDAANIVLHSLKSSVDDEKLTEDEGSAIKHVLEDKNIQHLLKIHETLEASQHPIEKNDYIELCLDIMADLQQLKDENHECRRLLDIMNNPNFRCLIESHDNIVYETYKLNDEQAFQFEEDLATKPVRVVGLSRPHNEPLGITLGRHSDNCVYIRRILRGTMVEKQGLVNAGDIVKEINGEPVGTNLELLQERLNKCEGSISMKTVPTMNIQQRTCEIYLRCQFEYNPLLDKDLPKHDSGLAFKKGDIIKVVDQSDNEWWQACHIDDEKAIGIVPSMQFEQRRRSTSMSESRTKKVIQLFTKNKKKILYNVSKCSMFDCLDIPIYEEVTKMPPFERRLVVLIGAAGVGRQSIKNQLLKREPDIYAAALADTSRPPREDELSGVGYNFLNKETMVQDITLGLYLEWGEYNKHYYGTKLDTIRDVMNSGKICLIDCDPSALKYLKTAEFMPVIVFIEALPIETLIRRNGNDSTSMNKSLTELKQVVKESNEMNEIYYHYFDLTLRNENLDDNITALQQHLFHLKSNSNWVPANWVY